MAAPFEHLRESDIQALLASSPDGAELAFLSTRDVNESDPATWQDALVKGLAPDGGLYDPHHLPPVFDEDFFTETLPRVDLSEGVSDVSALVLRRFLPREDIPDQQLLDMLREAHNFGIPLEDITDAFEDVIGADDPGKVMMAWLDRGPTASFKDFAARVMGQLLEWWCGENEHPINILVATSGDTGVAIARAFEGSKWVSVTVLYPHGGVSEIQEKQMIQADQLNENVQCFPIEGDFDRAQSMSKILQETRGRVNDLLLFSDEREAFIAEVQSRIGQELTPEQVATLGRALEKTNLGSANSINAWRYMPQMTQFFVAYARAIQEEFVEPGGEVVYSVPSGNIGHIMAGITAREMGVPIKGFVMATNQNDVMSTLVNEGVLRHQGLDESIAPSMDILNASNAERLLDYARRKADPNARVDYVGIRKVFDEASALKVASEADWSPLLTEEREKLPQGETLDEETLRALFDKTLEAQERLKFGINLIDFGVTPAMITYLQSIILFAGGVANDEEIAQTMRWVHTKTDGRAMPDSHGATGVQVVHDGLEQEVEELRGAKIISLVTASPHKFPKANALAGISSAEIPKKYRHPELEQATQGVEVEQARRAVVTSLVEVMENIRSMDKGMEERRAA